MPNLAPVVTRASGSLAVARKRSIQLYRDWQKNVPMIITEYHIPIPQSVIRAKIREEFEKNKHASDLSTIDVLLLKGRLELEETVNVWKQYSHLMHYFDKEDIPQKPGTFLERFYEGSA
ncbi:ndufa6 NADH-ubiquinone oxidoreductase subunit [Mycoemilia scoparia]|uniref:Ndufa6 NADH-ubiquinone oxidoreductase subunit n=1 Tax=Mycoemilia scoparia TaxID=417184 RepID=A0A9W7ZKG3_9FUNG|nr:ndufa6 NADH-ubiquinone oxidoreductase subunit [Mycoemilia scoparia]